MRKKYFTPEVKHEARKALSALRRAEKRQHFRDKAKAYRLRNPQQIKDSVYQYRLKRSYGLTPDDVRVMWEKQGGVCPLCDRAIPLRGRPTAIDHCHTTGRVRGLLCDPCNRWLGKFEKRGPSGALRACDYLGWK